jgi:hypothetical protein
MGEEMESIKSSLSLMRPPGDLVPEPGLGVQFPVSPKSQALLPAPLTMATQCPSTVLS